MAQSDFPKAQQIIFLATGFIKGELNFQEQQELTAWRNEGPENERLFQELVNEHNRSAAVKKMQGFDTEAALSRVKLKLKDQQERRPKKLYWYAAAAAVLIMGIGALLFQNKPVEMKTVYAAYGKQVEVHLPDSTKVWLNAGTTLQYPSKFAKGQRNVTLTDGEAYFEVTHDSAHPFVVHANGAVINVLGTSFEISAFKNEQLARITVRTGKVGVIPAKEKTVFLLPGDRATVNKETYQTQITKIDTADISAWRSERMIFNNQPMAEVFRSLERKYNVHIVVKNQKLLRETITMRLNNQPLANVLTAISFSNHFKYQKINEQSVIVN